MDIVKTAEPWTSDRNFRTLRALQKAYPRIRAETLTWTAYGRPLELMTLGTGGRKVFFSAAHHANEWITAPVLMKFMETLAAQAEAGGTIGGKDAAKLLEQVTVKALPLVDPDGVDLVTGAIQPDTPQYEKAKLLSVGYPEIPFPSGWRQAREIKFRKGFRTPGPRDFVGTAPLNQRETFALARFTEQFSPDLVVALHSQGQVIYWQYENYQIPGARALGEKMAAVSGYALADTPYASSFAGYKDWFIGAFRRPGYTVEVGLGENPLPISQFDSIYERVEPLLAAAAAGQ